MARSFVISKEKGKEADEISEQEYLEYLITTYQNLIFSICYKITGNYFESEDLSQETFLSAYKNFSKFDGANEKAWLARIATNKSLDFKRKAESKQIVVEDSYFQGIEDKGNATEDLCLEELERERLLTYCKGLKAPYHEIAIAYFYEEQEISVIAEKLKRNEKTVQTQIYRAKAILQKNYEMLGKEREKTWKKKTG